MTSGVVVLQYPLAGAVLARRPDRLVFWLSQGRLLGQRRIGNFLFVSSGDAVVLGA